MKTLLILLSIVLFFNYTDTYAESKTKVEYLNSGAVFSKTSDLPFSEAVRVDNTIYLSGQIGVKPGTFSLAKGGIVAETKQTLNNIKAILNANDLSMKNIVKCTIMLADISEWASFNEVYVTYFRKPFPARSAFASSGLALGAKVEVECIAVDH